MTAAPRRGAESPRLAVLDGVRGLAILLVMPSHFWGLAFGVTGRKPTVRIDHTVGNLFSTGWIGVDLFFVLSGFLITGLLLDAKGSGFYYRNFYARRFLRIFPAYYGFLAIVLLLFPLSATLNIVADVDNVRASQWWYWTYLVNIGGAFKDSGYHGSLANGHFWSLAVEEQFYVFWPTIVLILRPSSLRVLCIALIVGCFGLRMYMTSDAASSWAALNAAHIFTPARMDTFAIGALLALAARGTGDLAAMGRWAPLVAVCSGIMLAALYVSRGGLSTLDPQVLTLGLCGLAVLFGALLTMVVTAPTESALERVFSCQPLTFLGRYAYGLYIVHVLVSFYLANRIVNIPWLKESLFRTYAGSEIPSNAAITTIGITISIAIAWVSWHAYEKQFLKLKRFVPYGRRPADVRDEGTATAATGLTTP